MGDSTPSNLFIGDSKVHRAPCDMVEYMVWIVKRTLHISHFRRKSGYSFLGLGIGKDLVLPPDC
jgi:hypothetical protein